MSRNIIGNIPLNDATKELGGLPFNSDSSLNAIRNCDVSDGTAGPHSEKRALYGYLFRVIPLKR
jgi:hypothetical protein